MLCTDAIQFPGEPASAYEEIRRVLRPGGRTALTCWEPLDRNDERLSPRIRRANLGVGLHQAGFTDVEVRDRPSWRARNTSSVTCLRDSGDLVRQRVSTRNPGGVTGYAVGLARHRNQDGEVTCVTGQS